MPFGGGVTPKRYHPARRVCIGSLPSSTALHDRYRRQLIPDSFRRHLGQLGATGGVADKPKNFPLVSKQNSSEGLREVAA